MKRQDEPKVTLEARGEDAREVFANLFRQVDRDFVLNLPAGKPVYLTLREVPFLRALNLLCEATQTRFSVRDGVYYISPAEPEPRPAPASPTPPAPKRVRLVGNGLTLNAIAQEIRRQAGVEVVLEPNVPNLRLNLNLPAVTVEEALDALCRGTGLKWDKTEKGYRIRFEEPAVRATPSPSETATPPLRTGSG
ncbi:MAG: STN domain-containing protein, partial [Fimbriimonadales bacterium]